VLVLEEAVWRARQRDHRERVANWTGAHRERRRLGRPHPVLDFLFVYYSFRPSRLERWHPGPGVVLSGDSAEYLDTVGYHRVPGGVAFEPGELPEPRRDTARFILRLLRASAARSPRLTCFGLHEWAMVYRDSPRHEQLPLRLGDEGTDAVVERSALRCTHHDAFRFFSPAARPRNADQPTRQDQIELEQPGCLHANMDLYKWAYKLYPATPSVLLVDCFELALRTRELDMRASPYDLTELGYQPVPIETAAGRASYAREQGLIAASAAPLRQRLITLAESLVGTDPVGTDPPLGRVAGLS
jgi:hypothetical protein